MTAGFLLDFFDYILGAVSVVVAAGAVGVADCIGAAAFFPPNNFFKKSMLNRIMVLIRLNMKHSTPVLRGKALFPTALFCYK